MLKVAILLKRASGLSPEAFQKRWREEGPAAARRVQGIRRYVQSHPLLQGYARGDLAADGLEELWIDPRHALDLAWTPLLERRSGLIDPDASFALPVDVHVIKDRQAPDNAVKSIELVTRRPGMALAPFRRYWCDVHGPLAAAIPTLIRYEQNHTADLGYAMTPPARLDGLAITWFASTAAMREGTRSRAYERTRSDEPHFLPDGHLPVVLAREHEVIV